MMKLIGIGVEGFVEHYSRDTFINADELDIPNANFFARCSIKVQSDSSYVSCKVLTVFKDNSACMVLAVVCKREINYLILSIIRVTSGNKIKLSGGRGIRLY